MSFSDGINTVACTVVFRCAVCSVS